MLRRSIAAVLGIALAGCAVMQANNAAFYADQAQRIAQNCPVASAAAAAAQEAADAADAAYATYTTEAGTLGRMEAQRADLERRLQDAQREAAAAERALGAVQASREGAGNRQAMLDACIRMTDCYNRHAGEDGSLGGTYCESQGLGDASLGMEVCPCSNWSQCSSLVRALLGGSEADLKAAEQRRNEARERLEKLQQALDGMTQPMAAQNTAVNNALSTVRQSEQDAYDAMQAAMEACDESVFAAGPTPAGTYPQDVFGAQSRGLPGGSASGPACAVGSPTQMMCTPIQVMCIASCSAGGASCSPGAPAGCMACFAAGCF